MRQAVTPLETTFSILCYSHLIWEQNLFQRPQQLMTQLEGLSHDFLYVSLMSSKRWARASASEKSHQIGRQSIARNLPYLPLQRRFDFLYQLNKKRLRSIGQSFFNTSGSNKKILWIQHPEFYQLAKNMERDLLIYDVMDPFRSFSSKQPNVVKYEEELLQDADLVFTGGRSLHQQIDGMNPQMHCFPSGIDFPHFAKAAEEGAIPEDLKQINGPVLGYFGAIDERIDWDLVRNLCQANAEWSVVFLGPLVMMDACPIQEPNFHHLGAKPYASLPDYLRGFDVSLIPWLVNDLTSFMSPTKTPEYLAGGRPVVSAAIPDVVSDYADDVFVAHHSEEFIAHCRTALEQGVGPARKPDQSRTWIETAEAMSALIAERLNELK